ncbi:hypothetical protein FB567DRAFT_527064 [Paraphoma chrysanthemicola]|uniref:Uncharacterized protein n=1 Tax=Paraphoma chrysanthemicola TaxID=798071 RepID=A0A8K0R4Y8_9PLEO|nr:hypothetical protein FB567DRAFT_527064 [Paraphoma chrysanthemicola]
MCYYRLYIFLGCGHSTTSSSPVRYCATATKLHKDETQAADVEVKTTSTGLVLDLNAGSKPDWRSVARDSAASTASQRDDEDAPPTTISSGRITREPCKEGHLHPIHTVKLERVCADCADERDERLRKLEDLTNEVRFDPAGRYGDRRSFVGMPKKREAEGVGDGTVGEGGGGGHGSAAAGKKDSGVWTMGARWVKDWKGV